MKIDIGLAAWYLDTNILLKYNFALEVSHLKSFDSLIILFLSLSVNLY